MLLDHSIDYWLGFGEMFDIQPSLTHTVASVYTLCFTQIAAVSLKILQSSVLHNETVFFYDGSQKYFHHWHGLAGFFAVTVLLFFIVIPSVYLTIYPFRWFQKCFSKVKFKKDFLISVTDVFHGPFRKWNEQFLGLSVFSWNIFYVSAVVVDILLHEILDYLYYYYNGSKWSVSYCNHGIQTIQEKYSHTQSSYPAWCVYDMDSSFQ